MNEYRAITTEESGLYETCARHTARQTCRLVQTAYFCDECTIRLVHQAFNERPPIYHGETVQGYCGLCNRTREVTMRQWFVCGPCWNFILAYQKSIAATAGVHEWWNNKINVEFPNLVLQETEPLVLQPFVHGKLTKMEKAQTLDVLDFLVVDTSTKPPTKLFHIEQKTGPGSIEKMREFQLDVNDFNDIAGAMNSTKIPSYIIHVQIEHEYAPPTRKTKVVNMWWSDIYKIFEKRKRIANRRGEEKRAIYFKPGAFTGMETFAEEIKSEQYTVLANRLAQLPVQLIS